jgi:5-methylcytosine-specific restriction endonuclease McrA
VEGDVTEQEQWQLDYIRRLALRMVVDFAFQCGVSLKGLGYFDRKCRGRFYLGHGGSINVQLLNDRALVDVDGRLFTMSENPSGEIIQLAADSVMGVIGMHFEAAWEQVITPCQAPICNKARGRWQVCNLHAGRWMCGECISRLSLCEPVYHRTGETAEERSERDKMTPSLRYDILERDKFTCQSCGRTPPDVKLHVDHKIPVALGGRTVPENLHALCADCNLGKSAKMPSQATLDFWEQIHP